MRTFSCVQSNFLALFLQFAGRLTVEGNRVKSFIDIFNDDDDDDDDDE